MPSIPIEFAVTILTIVVGFVGWEWKKVVASQKTEEVLKTEINNLKSEMKTLHEEHQKLLQARDGEHANIMRNMTDALNNLNNGIGQLTHYIKWLSQQQTGKSPPPPL